MKRNTYLTVDLDYWYSAKITGDGNDFINKLIALNRPMTLFTEHHLILKDIDKQYKKVYNVDYHSDIADKAVDWPNCGTWANYFCGRENAVFEWRYPNKNKCIEEGNGLCHPGHKSGSEFDPFFNPELWSWQQIKRQQGLDNIDLDSVDKISLILSPMWSNCPVIAPTLMNIANNDIVKFFSKSAAKTLLQMIDDIELEDAAPTSLKQKLFSKRFGP